MTDRSVDVVGWNNRLRDIESSGDAVHAAALLAPIGEELVEAAGILVGERVLDLGAGLGTVSIAAAKRGARVSAIDVSANLVDRGRERSAAAGVEVDWQVADLHDLPYKYGSFDVVLSNFGVVRAAEPARAANGILNVLAPAGRLFFTAWHEHSFNGRANELIASLLPDDSGRPLVDQHYWAELDHVHGWFTPRTAHLRTHADTSQTYDSAEAWWGALQELPEIGYLKKSVSAEAYEHFREQMSVLCARYSAPDPSGGIRCHVDYVLAAIR